MPVFWPALSFLTWNPWSLLNPVYEATQCAYMSTSIHITPCSIADLVPEISVDSYFQQYYWKNFCRLLFLPHGKIFGVQQQNPKSTHTFVFAAVKSYLSSCYLNLDWEGWGWTPELSCCLLACFCQLAHSLLCPACHDPKPIGESRSSTDHINQGIPTSLQEGAVLYS